jgi:hypothetical protein
MAPTMVTERTLAVRDRYRTLLRAGFTQHEATSLIAHADGIEGHPEGAQPSGVSWRWQEIARIEFLRYLVQTGRLIDSPAPRVVRP